MNKLCILLLCLFSHSVGLASSPTEILMAVGQSRSFKLGDQDKAWIEKPKLFHIEELTHQLRLRAAKPGESLVQVGRKHYQIKILAPAQFQATQLFQKASGEMMGLSAQFDSDEVTITGELLRMEDWIHLAELAQSQSLKLRWQSRIAEELRAKAQKFFEEKFKAAALPPPLLEVEPTPRILVSADEKEHLSRAKVLAAVYGLSLESSTLRLSLAPMVRVKITLAEVRRDSLTRYGIKWPESLSVSASGVQSAAIQIQDIEVTLNALAQEGEGRVLASPTLLCRSGKEAEFLAGGEIPIKVSGYQTQGVIWKRYGVLLKVTPKADATGQMSIGITTEVSSIDPGNTVSGVPGFFTNRVQTHFDLKKSETIVISGLIRQMDGQTTEALPGLAQLPYLGLLFSSKEFRSQTTELIAFVTPEIVK